LFDWETQINTIYRGSSGNCNFQYLSGLAAYLNKPNVALVHILTTPAKDEGRYAYANVAYMGAEPKYAGTAYAMYLFAQGSEDPIKLRPYGPQLKETIEANGLGQVMDCGPAPNLMHNKKPGVLYVWKIDHAACAKWWDVNVHNAWKERNEREAVANKEADTVAKEAQKVTEKETKNAEAIIGKMFAGEVPAKPKRWRCMPCYLLNPSNAEKCVHCGQPRRKLKAKPYIHDYIFGRNY
jgi:hypothetical protein